MFVQIPRMMNYQNQLLQYYTVLSSFITYHRVCKKSNMTDATFGTGNVDPSGALEFTPGFKSGSCCSNFSFLLYVLQIVVCPFVFFLLAIVFHRFTTSGYPFGIFKLQIIFPATFSTPFYRKNSQHFVEIFCIMYRSVVKYFKPYRYISNLLYGVISPYTETHDIEIHLQLYVQHNRKDDTFWRNYN